MPMQHDFETRADASIAAADFIETALSRRLASDAGASLVVSGGSSPATTFAHLSHRYLDWDRVRIFLSDERWVSADDENSNERLVRRSLLKSRASFAELESYYQPGVTVEQRCAGIDQSLRALASPFACSLLGMGEDGHFASLFPDAANLQQGLAENGDALSLPARTAASELARISLTLAALLRSDDILLLAFGAKKKAVIAEALAGTGAYPVAALLRQTQTPVHIFWAP